ncbi:MAG: SPOR domain-containing protein [Acidovorax sp.]|nr:SPOR domain-containing protein [Acidovorax sp.]
MLRIAVLILLLANAGYYAWTQGWLRAWGLAPQEQSEPERMANQIRPEALRILPGKDAPAPAPEAPAAAASTPAGAPAGGECLQAGTFDERQAEALRAAAAALPQGSWALEAAVVPGRWMVYMGRFADNEALEKKRAELRSRNVAYDRPGAALEPGLSLGRFSSEEAAARELANLGKQGVRTARVVQERPEAKAYTLRLPAVDAALRPQLDTLRPALAGKALRACGG